MVDAGGVPKLVKLMQHNEEYDSIASIANSILMNMCDGGVETFNVLIDAGVVDSVKTQLVTENQATEILQDTIFLARKLLRCTDTFCKVESLVEPLIKVADKNADDVEILIDVCGFYKNIVERFYASVDVKMAFEMLMVIRNIFQIAKFSYDIENALEALRSLHNAAFFSSSKLTNQEWLEWAFQTDMLTPIISLTHHRDDKISLTASLLAKAFKARLVFFKLIDIYGLKHKDFDYLLYPPPE